MQPPGTAMMFEDETVLQCRCRLTWLLAGTLALLLAAGVTCRWTGLEEAREEE